MKNRAVVLEPAFQCEELAEAWSALCLLVFSVQSCAESWLRGFFFIIVADDTIITFYCSLSKSQCTVQLPDYHCVWMEYRVALGSTGFSQVAVFQIFRECDKTRMGNTEFSEAFVLFLCQELTSALDNSASEITYSDYNLGNSGLGSLPSYMFLFQ